MDEGLILGSAESPLPPSILRGLVDRTYEKRKLTGLEVSTLVHSLWEQNRENDRINQILVVLSQDFCKSKNSSHRKGGLIGLSGCAVALSEDLKSYLSLIVPAILDCFLDSEPRVCYYACEALFNVARVGRGVVEPYFPLIFDSMCKLIATAENEVRNGLLLLNNLIKDIITESDSFEEHTFVLLLQEQITSANPNVRALLVGWISALNGVPDWAILNYLPQYLSGLFDMLTDTTQSVRASADILLNELLIQLRTSHIARYDYIIAIISAQCKNKSLIARLRALEWLNVLMKLGERQLSMFYSDLQNTIALSIASSDTQIAALAMENNEILMTLVMSTECKDMQTLVMYVVEQINSPFVISRITALTWLQKIFEKDSNQVILHLDYILPSLCKLLSDDSTEVLILGVQVLALLCTIQNEHLESIFQSVIQSLCVDRILLEKRGSFLVRKFCIFLNARKVFVVISNALRVHNDTEFACLMIQILTLLLLTAPELSSLRHELRHEGSGEGSIFSLLFRCWSVNVASTYCLCLLAEMYQLSAAIITEFESLFQANDNDAIGVFVQLENLLLLIESPNLSHLRLKLVDTNNHDNSSLMVSLNGLLMAVPQSAACRTLTTRLSSISSLHMTLAFERKYVQGKAEKENECKEVESDNQVKCEEYMNIFRNIQKLQQNFSV